MYYDVPKLFKSLIKMTLLSQYTDLYLQDSDCHLISSLTVNSIIIIVYNIQI